MNTKSYGLFPTPVFRYNMGRDTFFNDEKSFFDRIKKETKPMLGSGLITKDKFILEHKEMFRIKEFCETCLNDFFKTIYQPADSVKVTPYITQSWINFLDKGYSHMPHTHPNSMFSGVFYIDVDSELDSIEFIRHDYQQFRFLPKEMNDFNTTVVSLKVNNFDLVLFPSSMYHTVPPTTNPNTRISLAFNSFLKGTFGDKNEQLNYLEL